MVQKLKIMILLFCLTVIFQSATFAENQFAVIDEQHAVVSISYKIDDSKAYKVAIIQGNKKQFYPLTSANQNFSIPFGDGSYIVALYERVEGNSYVLKQKSDFNLNLNESSRYLASVYDIDWSHEDEIAVLAKNLVKDANTDQEKVERIYKFVVETISYDYSKVQTVQSGYVPDYDQILSSGKGICYDYASMTAAMLRSVGIPTQLCMGYSDEVPTYHAWNKVLVNDVWLIIDTTVDSVNSSHNSGDLIYKNGSMYKMKKTF